MSRNSVPPPTRDELKEAVPDLLYAASQAASFGYLNLIEEEENFVRLKDAMPNVDHTLNTAFLELSLIFIRKTTEFFKPPDRKDANDTLFAYRYLPEWKGCWVIEERLYAELHKRVGHITLMEARHGKFVWPIERMTLNALEHWKVFFCKLSTSPIYEGSPPEAELGRCVAALELFAKACEGAFRRRRRA